MIRFLLKTAFVIGIGSLFIPGLGSDDDEVALDPFQSFMGMRVAVEDVMGFCARAPEACEAGSQFGEFAIDRVESGISIAVDAVTSDRAKEKTEEDPVPAHRPEQPKSDWSSIDPALIRELAMALKDDEKLSAQNISPDLINAVRGAVNLTARGVPLDSQIAERLDTIAANADSTEIGVSPVPIPRPRPAL